MPADLFSCCLKSGPSLRGGVYGGGGTSQGGCREPMFRCGGFELVELRMVKDEWGFLETGFEGREEGLKGEEWGAEVMISVFVLFCFVCFFFPLLFREDVSREIVLFCERDLGEQRSFQRERRSARKNRIGQLKFRFCGELCVSCGIFLFFFFLSLFVL